MLESVVIPFILATLIQALVMLFVLVEYYRASKEFKKTILELIDWQEVFKNVLILWVTFMLASYLLN